MMLRSVVALLTALASASALVSPAYETIRNARVTDPRTDAKVSILDDAGTTTCVVLLPQLGEFDSAEMCEQLAAVRGELSKGGVNLKVIGIGESKAAESFCKFTGLSPDCLLVYSDASLHKELGLHAGPGWKVPEFVNDDILTFLLNTLPGGAPSDPSMLRAVGDAWFNYLAMCAGIGAPGTLQEILRGYFGDYDAPERFAPDDFVKAGFVEIGPGVGPVSIGPLKYSQWWEDERGYQRPVELATVRLKNMVEVLTKWDEYVTNPLAIAQRGATYIFDASGEALYEYRHRGVLTYSETMPRPLSFLAPYIGEDLALNPLGLRDEQVKSSKGRGILKPAGKAMSLLGPIFSAEAKLQAQVQGADSVEARKSVEKIIAENHVVIFTYGLSPFSIEALALLDEYYGTELEGENAAAYKKVELGLEWFLLDGERSAMRAALLEMTGQSSLPHIFIGGKHVGGLFSGGEGSGGLAGLHESGELGHMIAAGSSVEKPASIKA